MNFKRFLPILLCLILLNNCVDEIDIGIPKQADFLVVDGILNYHANADSSDLVVRLNISRNTNVRPIPLGKAKMELIVNDKDSYPLPERETGFYYLFNKEALKVGNSYKLRFQLDGEDFESTNEVLPDSVALGSVYSEINPNGTSQTAYELFIDMQDDPTQKNYYRWLMTQWEKQEFCEFCYRQNRAPEICTETDVYAVPDTPISRNRRCDGDCFYSVRITPNNSISDIFISGKKLIKKSIGYSPFIFNRSCLIEVKQSTLTPQYYSFLEILRSQAESTGGLADTPPALLIGNVRNLSNPSQQIVGYFSVTNNSIRRYWLDRKDGVASGYQPLADRNPPLDPPVPAPASWQPIPCKKSNDRTPIKPVGWRD